MLTEQPDYGDWSDKELSEELLDVETAIANCQTTIANTRKILNRNMDIREQLLDLISQRAIGRGRFKK